jgi:hypothetical protein
LLASFPVKDFSFPLFHHRFEKLIIFRLTSHNK